MLTGGLDAAVIRLIRQADIASPTIPSGALPRAEEAFIRENALPMYGPTVHRNLPRAEEAFIRESPDETSPPPLAVSIFETDISATDSKQPYRQLCNGRNAP